jgi:hypothetical protein
MVDKNDDLEKQNKLLKDQAVEAGHVDNAYKSIAATLSHMFEEVIDSLNGVDNIGAKIAKSYERDIVGSIKKMSGGLEKNLGLQQKINKGQNVSSEIEAKMASLKSRALLTSQKISRAEGLSTEAKLKMRTALREQYILEKDNLKSLGEQNKEKQKNKGWGDEITEGLSGQLDKLDKSGTLSSIISGEWKDIAGSTKVAQAFIMLLVKNTLAANKSVTGIQKSMGVSSVHATGMRVQMAAIAFTANDLRVTTEKLIAANATVNSQYQTAAIYNKDILKGATAILDAEVMSGEAVAQLSGDAARLGMTFDESLKTQQDALNNVNAQTGAQISLQTVLEASNRVTGQIRAQLGSNPEAIAKAVTQAKALGYELEQIANAGKALLSFESSIEAELEAELLTGKQLNLEKARLAALTGDYETLTKEIAANVGDWNDFTKMNVLQQEAIAKSVGMTADDLANSLITEENRGALLADAIAAGDEQQIQNLKALDTQEKFAAVMLQIKGLIVDIMTPFSIIADVVGLIGDGLGTWIGKLIGLIAAFKIYKALQIGGAIASIWGKMGGLPVVGPIMATAAVLAMMGAISRYSKADDARYGDNKLITKNKDQINFNNQDAILLAGTNLGGGGGGGEKIDYDKMASAMSKARVNVTTKHDSFSANSTTAHGGNYQSDARYESKYV